MGGPRVLARCEQVCIMELAKRSIGSVLGLREERRAGTRALPALGS